MLTQSTSKMLPVEKFVCAKNLCELNDYHMRKYYMAIETPLAQVFGTMH